MAKGLGIAPEALRASHVCGTPNVGVARYCLATVRALVLAGARDVEDLVAGDFAVEGRADDAARDFDADLDADGFAALRRAGARTSSSCPG